MEKQPHNTGTYLLEVTSYQDGVLKGTLTNSISEEKTSFCGAIELLLLIDRPHIWTESAATMKIPPEGIAAFQITIYFHQHTSWQGTIRWAEQNEERCFRSTLELILLLDTALRGDSFSGVTDKQLRRA